MAAQDIVDQYCDNARYYTEDGKYYEIPIFSRNLFTDNVRLNLYRSTFRHVPDDKNFSGHVASASIANRYTGTKRFTSKTTGRLINKNSEILEKKNEAFNMDTKTFNLYFTYEAYIKTKNNNGPSKYCYRCEQLIEKV